MSDISSGVTGGDAGATTEAPPPQGETPAERQVRQSDGKFGPKHPVQESQQVAAKPKAGPVDGTTGELNKRANGSTGVGETQPPAEPAKPPAPEKWKLTSRVDGNEVEEEVDRETVQRERQKWLAADKRFQEAAAATKRAERIQRAIVEGDDEVLRELGIDLDDISAQRMAAKAKRSLLPPEQVELEEVKARNAKLEQQFAEQERQRQDAAQQQQDVATWQAMEPEITAALTELDIPRDVASLRLVLSVLAEDAAKGVDLTPKQAAQEVARRQGVRAQRYVWAPYKTEPARLVADIRKNGLMDAVRVELEREWQQKSGLAQPKAAPPPEPERQTGDREVFYSESQWMKSLRGG